MDGLRARADDGAAVLLAGLLEEQGDLEGAMQILRAQVDAGNEAIAWRLPELLIRQGRLEEAKQVRRFGLNPDGSAASS